MSRYTAAVVGTGPEPDNVVWGESASMAYNHGTAYRDLPASRLVACCDIVRENAEAFAEAFEIPDEHVFVDAAEMLRVTDPDIVSVATPVPTHADIVTGLVETGVPAAIHCEKPMADTWGDSQRMAAEAADAGVQLTFNHQRRLAPEWRRATEVLESGRVGDLTRIGVGGKNVFDFGSHMVDLANGFNGERDAEWVLAGVHYDDENERYGVHNENQAVATWEYENGVRAFASTDSDVGSTAAGCLLRLVGTNGTIEVHPDGGPTLRYRADDTDGWIHEDPESDMPSITLAIEHVLETLGTDEEPVLSVHRALRATETIFGIWESARRRERVDFPLEYGGNALSAMVESGELNPE